MPHSRKLLTGTVGGSGSSAVSAQHPNDTAEMLTQRLVTASLLLLGILAAIWLLPPSWLYALFSLFGLLAAFEWTRLMGWTRWTWLNTSYVALSAAVLAILWPIRLVAWPWLSAIAIGWWMVAIWLILGYPKRIRCRPSVIQLGLVGQLLWPPAVICLTHIRDQAAGEWKLIYVLTLVWAADSGAYFVGRKFGRHKLAPNLSPGKTAEGAAAGICLSVIWALAFGEFVFRPQVAQPGWLIAIGFAGAVMSIIGDLTMSLFKRLIGLKDTGTILPGHGGILDRVDGLLAAIPVVTVGLGIAGLVS